MTTAATFVYPENWPATPFHRGEVETQKQLKVHDHVQSYAPRVIRPYMPEQHREFYEAQPFLVVAARDEHGSMWSTLLVDTTSTDDSSPFISSPSPTTLCMEGRPLLTGDALEQALRPGSDLGILGIEFGAKRRNRVNGRIVSSTQEGGLEFRVDQSFGNCPQYIKPRRWWRYAASSSDNDNATTKTATRTDKLSASQMDKISKAETIFVASGYRPAGESDDPRFGNDASHRGGPGGFVKVHSPTLLGIPDFSGNNHYNTIGNLVLDPRMGVTFPQYETGGMIQLSGTAKIDFDEAKAAATYPGAKRVIEFTVRQVVELPDGSLPLRWASNDDDSNRRKLKVTKKKKESENVMSFYLRPLEEDDPTLWRFQAGQHLPITLTLDADKCVDTAGCEELMRTYSLSAGPDWGEYRISVKREELGDGSRFLHDSVEEGDVITVNKPAGDFVLDEKSTRTLVLLSAGIGVTPILSMLHKYVSVPDNKRMALWIHGARDGKHHPFQGEVKELKKLAGDALKTHIVYSQPRKEDTEYDSTGRINVELLQGLVHDLKEADIYMCGSGAFMAEIESGLEKLSGFDPKRIHFETF